MEQTVIAKYLQWTIVRIESKGFTWWKFDRGEGLPFRRCGTRAEAMGLLEKVKGEKNAI